MDFDIGNFLYILLMLVFVILGSLGKKKKPAPPQNIGEEEGEKEIRDIPADIFEENIRKYFLKEESEKTTQPETPYESAEYSAGESIDMPQSPWDKYSGVLDTPVSEEGVPTTSYRIEDHIEEINRISKLNYLSMQTAKKTDFVKRALKNFDPKKAILYKEVFEPKYF